MNRSGATYEIHEFIRHLLSAVAAASLYTLNHPQVKRLADAAYASMARALSERPDIALLEVDGELVIDGEPQPFSLVLDRFVLILQQQGIGHLRFLANASRQEVDALICLLSGQSDHAAAESTDHIRLGKVEMPEEGGEFYGFGSGRSATVSTESSGGISGGSATSLKDIPGLELSRLTEIYEAIKRKERLRPSGIAATVSELLEAFRKEGEALLVLAALREQDEYTFTHAANVCILTLAQARSLGISGQLLNDIGIAAMLHDVGKLFVPEEILTKPEQLTDDEYAQMKQHPVLGARYLMETSGVPRLAAITAFEHHMRFDQSGYPLVSSDWQQSISSQMTAISDCFDAMRTRRSYQEPRTPKVIAGALVRGSGTEFNPLLVRNMLQLLSRLNRI